MVLGLQVEDGDLLQRPPAGGRGGGRGWQQCRVGVSASWLASCDEINAAVVGGGRWGAITHWKACFEMAMSLMKRPVRTMYEDGVAAGSEWEGAGRWTGQLMHPPSPITLALAAASGAHRRGIATG